MSAAYQQSTATVDPFSPARELLEDVIHRLSSLDAFSMDHAEVESYVGREGCEVQRRLLQAHLDLRTHAERRVKVIGADGEEKNALLVLTADAAGIVVREEDLRLATKKALAKSLERQRTSDGPQKHRRRTEN